MKKLLITSAAVAALVFSACSTNSESMQTSNVAQMAQTAAALSSLAGSDSKLAMAVKAANGVVSATENSAAITIPETALKGGKLDEKTMATLDVVAETLKATGATAKVAKVGAANTFTKKSADYLTSKGVTVENVAKVATSDNKIATGVSILLSK